MRKIRIGNDIRLKLSIMPNEDAGFDRVDEFDLSNIKSVRCYLINTSFFEKPDPEDKKKFRRVGFPDYYLPTAHNINNSGFPSYHMMPASKHNYDEFLPDFHGFHWWPGFRGFGMHPEHFRPIPEDMWGKHGIFPNHPHEYNPYYLADSNVMHEVNTITCLFPAMHQLMCGTYKLVVILTVFEAGWGRENLRTYTIDKGDVFELVDDNTGESGNITIAVDERGDRENMLKGIFADEDTDDQDPDKNVFYMASNTVLRHGAHDVKGKQYNIFCVLNDDSTVVYNPYDWHFNELVFSVEDGKENELTVDKDGVLRAHDPLYGIESRVKVTVQDYDDLTIKYEFTVVIQNLDTILIGFDEENNVENMYPTKNTMFKYNAKANCFVINNPREGNFLWIYSQRKVQYVKSVEEDNSLPVQLSSGIRIPVQDYGIQRGYYCYRSTSPILAGDMYLKIKFDTNYGLE